MTERAGILALALAAVFAAVFASAPAPPWKAKVFNVAGVPFTT